MNNGRQYDPRPVPGETLREYIDRMICGSPAPRFREVWGWPPHSGFFDFSWVMTPADPTCWVNRPIQHTVQGI